MGIGHHTMDKGYVGVTKVVADLTLRGFSVLHPMYEQMPFDLVVYREGNFHRVQVKYRALVKGAMQVAFKASSVYTSGKTYSKPWDKDEIDLLAIYCPETDTCYYLNPKDFGKSVSLRTKPPANNQRRGVHMASDYTEPTLP